MAKILVTGGAGFVGSVLVLLLLSAGHVVIVFDNLMYQQNTFLQWLAPIFADTPSCVAEENIHVRIRGT